MINQTAHLPEDEIRQHLGCSHQSRESGFFLCIAALENAYLVPLLIAWIYNEE